MSDAFLRRQIGNLRSRVSSLEVQVQALNALAVKNKPPEQITVTDAMAQEALNVYSAARGKGLERMKAALRVILEARYDND